MGHSSHIAHSVLLLRAHQKQLELRTIDSTSLGSYQRWWIQTCLLYTCGSHSYTRPAKVTFRMCVLHRHAATSNVWNNKTFSPFLPLFFVLYPLFSNLLYTTHCSFISKTWQMTSQHFYHILRLPLPTSPFILLLLTPCLFPVRLHHGHANYHIRASCH